MKKLLSHFVSLLVLFCLSCNHPNQSGTKTAFVDTATFINSGEVIEQSPNNTTSYEKINLDSIVGYYVGSFNAVTSNSKKHPMDRNKINLSIDSIQSDSILFGHSIVAGNFTSFIGNLKQVTTILKCNAKEIGNSKYNGVFNFSLNPTMKTIEGNWFANDSTLPVTQRRYELTKKHFKYSSEHDLKDVYLEVYSELYSDDKVESYTDDIFKFNASTTLLKTKDVENMYKRDLELIRNAIYARHGYSFKNRVMRFVFDNEVDWYIPVSVNVTNELTDLEKKNIELIKRYEKHATSYYDSFGR